MRKLRLVPRRDRITNVRETATVRPVRAPDILPAGCGVEVDQAGVAVPFQVRAASKPNKNSRASRVCVPLSAGKGSPAAWEEAQMQGTGTQAARTRLSSALVSLAREVTVPAGRVIAVQKRPLPTPTDYTPLCCCTAFRCVALAVWRVLAFAFTPARRCARGNRFTVNLKAS